MTEAEIDQAMRERFRAMIAKCKTEQEKGNVKVYRVVNIIRIDYKE